MFVLLMGLQSDSNKQNTTNKVNRTKKESQRQSLSDERLGTIDTALSFLYLTDDENDPDTYACCVK